MSRLCVRISKCSRESLSLNGLLMTQYTFFSVGNGTGPEMVAPLRCAVSTIDFDKMTGVVTFPSFHGAIAFMTAFALRGVPRLASFAWAWSALVNISAIPMGGHYGTDLVVGDLLWALSAWFMIAIAREKERRDLAPTPDLALQT